MLQCQRPCRGRFAANIGDTSARIWPKCAKLGQHWRGLIEIGQTLAKVGQHLANIGQIRALSITDSANVAQSWLYVRQC